MSVWRELEHFRVGEFNHPDEMQYALLRALDDARHIAGVPFHITSDYRPDPDPDDNEDSAHYHGQAVDISDNLQGRPIGSRWRFHAMRGLINAGFTRIGDYDRHLHADVSLNLDQEVLWHGTSS